jgi:hypothetical protein
MAHRRRLAPLCLLSFAPSLAWAAPAPEDRPPIQRPAAPVADEPAEPADEAPPIEPADDAPSGAISTDTPSDEPLPEPEPKPEPERDLSNLLVSDEPEAKRVRVSAPDRSGVDHREAMRNYYARVYRPAHNPSRLYFAARGALALAGTSEGTGGGRLGFANAEVGQTWNYIGYGLGAALYAGGLTFGQDGVEKFGGVLVGGGPSLGLGRLGLVGRGFVDFRVGYNFFYAPISSTRPEFANPPNAAPHGPKVQVDFGLLLHDSESRRFRHGLGVSLGWQMLVHTFVGEYPTINSFNIGFTYFFG